MYKSKKAKFSFALAVFCMFSVEQVCAKCFRSSPRVNQRVAFETDFRIDFNRSDPRNRRAGRPVALPECLAQYSSAEGRRNARLEGRPKFHHRRAEVTGDDSWVGFVRRPDAEFRKVELCEHHRKAEPQCRPIPCSVSALRLEVLRGRGVSGCNRWQFFSIFEGF